MNLLATPASAPMAASPARDALADAPGYFVAGDGAPIVMLHSSLSSKSQWTMLAQRLASRYRAIAIDLCGYGDNPMPDAGSSFTLDDEVRLVADRLDRLVASHVRFHLIGHSYGGLVALRLAQCRSDRVASLALYEPVVFRLLDGDDAALAHVRRMAERVSCLVITGFRHDAAQAFVDFWSGAGTYASLPPSAQLSLARRIDKVPLDFRAASGWPHGPADFRDILAPTLLLSGHRSPAVTQRIHDALARALPNSSLAAFETGHMGPVTDAHRINPWFEAFVDICAGGESAFTARPAASQASGASAANR